MRKLYFWALLLAGQWFFGQQAVVITPYPFEVNEQITITIDENTTATDCNHLNNPQRVYMHAGIGDDSQPWQYVVGNWGQDDGVGQMTDNGDGTWSITLVPQTYFGLTDQQAATITKMGMVFRNEDGSQEYKDNGCRDFIVNVGALQVTMINPDETGVILVDYGGSTQILAQNSNGNADYYLYANDSLIHTQTNTSFYNGYYFQNLTENQFCELHVVQGSRTVIKRFVILVDNAQDLAMPQGMEDGINYDPADPTKATLVLTAPLKDFVYVAGSFNDWKPFSAHALKRDPSTGKFWVTLTGLTPGEIYTYQYWVADRDPVPNSPKLVKTADPFSTLVLSPYDDPYIPATTYPNLPPYPAGQEREVTVLQTNAPDYTWQVTNFQRPAKEDLIIYEVLIRDFDAHRNFQDLINRVQYFRDLGVNAVELMPVMEFEGNLGWGYNPAFHLALDKFYGTSNKFKEMVDVFHQNGIAVILDVSLNHAMGRNPMVRMWMDDPDGDGWGGPSSENPYFNQQATHAYGIGYDFNHSSPYTQYYTKRVIKHWIEEYKVDGFRWDLTKGFTQNCTSGDEACTNSYQQDRVDVLKMYADYTWSLDPASYVIFEHLGNADEEREWADYRLNEGKGIMLWGRVNDPYAELLMGQTGNRDITPIGHHAHNFAGKRLVGYFESHDEERIMYRALQYGNDSNSAHNVRQLPVALFRMRAIGAASLLVPGPKMIWHFSDLGMEQSLYTCEDGSVSPDCRLDTKPQPQWVNNWLNDPQRRQIYDDWSRIIRMKIEDPVFEGDYAIDAIDFTPRIYIWNDNLPATQLKNVVVLTNFDVVSHDVTPYFPYTGTWYDLMTNTTVNITDTQAPITLGPGEYKIYGNQASTVNIEAEKELHARMYPNPARDYIVFDIRPEKVAIYDISGKTVWKNTGNTSATVDISRLKPGFYVVKIWKNQASKSFKLIINR